MIKNTKYFFLLLSLLFLITANSFALPMNFAIDINRDGTYDTGSLTDPIAPFINYVNTSSWAAIDLQDVVIDATGKGTGTFEEISAINVLGDSIAGLFPWAPHLYEMTAVFEGAGDFTAQFGTGGDITDHAFDFSSGTIKMYAHGPNTLNPNTFDYGTASNNSFFGADNGTLMAEFSLIRGNGTLESDGGSGSVIDNVQTWSLDSSVTSGYFFDENDVDFNSLTSSANIFIQLHTNDTNEQQDPYGANATTISILDAEITEAINNNQYGYMNNPDKIARLYVGTSGKAYFEVVPEPATMFLFGLGLLGLVGISREKINYKN